MSARSPQQGASNANAARSPGGARSEPKASEGALSGIRVVELSNEKCAWAGKLLADMGADVILVEPPGGDPARGYGPYLDDEPGADRSLYWWHHHTSKRGIVLDLASEGGSRALRQLAAGVDVVLEAEAPGALAALGLDYPDLARVKPDLIHCSITPFGRSGPRKHELATDLTVLAAGGPVWMNGYDDHSLPPVRGLGNQGWATGCHYGVMSILTALVYRGVSGEGQHIDVSLHAAANVTTEAGSYCWLVARQTMQRLTGRHASATPTLDSQMKCADGAYVNTGVPPRKPAEFAKLLGWLRSLGLEPEFPEAVFLQMGAERASIDLSRIGQDEELTAIFGAGREAMNFIASRVSAYEFFSGAQRAGLAVGVIYAPEEAYEDAHFRARGFQVEVHHPEHGRSFRYPGAPYAMQKGAWRISRRAPRLGEHTQEVLREIGAT
jgi:crotonobetainyl-CoA:carnitine CoA-transferase CaiB-like acyl-CoA transferase